METMTVNPEKEEVADRPQPAAEIFDVHRTAEFLAVSPDTVYDLFASGDLPGRKVGRTWRTTKKAVVDWLETPHRYIKNDTPDPSLSTPPPRRHPEKRKAARKTPQNN